MSTDTNTKTIYLRVTEHLHRSIMRAAGDDGQRATDWARAALEKVVKEHPTYQSVAEDAGASDA